MEALAGTTFLVTGMDDGLWMMGKVLHSTPCANSSMMMFLLASHLCLVPTMAHSPENVCVEESPALQDKVVTEERVLVHHVGILSPRVTAGAEPTSAQKARPVREEHVRGAAETGSS